MGAAMPVQDTGGVGITPKPLVRWTIACLGCVAAAAAITLALAAITPSSRVRASLLDWIILFTSSAGWSRGRDGRRAGSVR